MAITTLGLPLNIGFLASMSPIARETESLPGITRSGPTIFSVFPSFLILIDASVLYLKK